MMPTTEGCYVQWLSENLKDIANTFLYLKRLLLTFDLWKAPQQSSLGVSRNDVTALASKLQFIQAPFYAAEATVGLASETKSLEEDTLVEEDTVSDQVTDLKGNEDKVEKRMRSMTETSSVRATTPPMAHSSGLVFFLHSFSHDVLQTFKRFIVEPRSYRWMESLSRPSTSG